MREKGAVCNVCRGRTDCLLKSLPRLQGGHDPLTSAPTIEMMDAEVMWRHTGHALLDSFGAALQAPFPVGELCQHVINTCI